MRTRSGSLRRVSTPTRGRGRGRGRGQPAAPVPSFPGSPAGFSSSGGGSDSDSGSDQESGSSLSSVEGGSNPLAVLQHIFPVLAGGVPFQPPAPFVLQHNPLFEPDSDLEESMTNPRSLSAYSGQERGTAGSTYLRQFYDQSGICRWANAADGLSKNLYLFVSGGSAATAAANGQPTPFDLWCEVEARPLAREIADAVATCVDNASLQAAYNQFKPRYDRVFERFTEQFCSPDISEYKALLSELLSVCQAHAGSSSLWQPLQHTLMKLQSYHRRPAVPSGVMNESELVVQLLSNADLMPETVSLRLKDTLAGLGDNQLPAAPANPPAGFNRRHTLGALVAAVSVLTQQQHQAAGWGVLPQPSHANAAVFPAASQHSVTATSSLSQAPDIHSKAAAMCAHLSHLGAEERCQLLAKAFPAALCPEHRMLHALKDCPFAVAESDKRAKVVKQVHATSLADEASLLSEGIVKRMTQELESVVESKFSAFAAGFNHGRRDRDYHDPDRRGGGGGYGQPRPIGAGFADGHARPPPPVCSFCDSRGHTAENCWILFPHKCKDRRRLDELVVPDRLQGVFQDQLAKLRLSDDRQQGAEPLPGDAYPPRATGQHHGMLHNHCVLTDAAQLARFSDDSAVFIDDSAFASTQHVMAVEIEYGDEDAAVSSPHAYEHSDAHSFTESLPELVFDSDTEGPPGLIFDSEDGGEAGPPVPAVPLEPLNNPVLLGNSESSDTDSLPSSPHSSLPVPSAPAPVAVPVAAPSAAVDGALVCECGSICRLQLQSVGEGSLLPVWECPKASSDACVSGVSATGSTVLHAFVARYSGTMPASFRPADNAAVNMVTRSAARAAAQAAQPSTDRVVPAVAPAEPAAPSVSVADAAVDTAPVEPPADPAVVTPPEAVTAPRQDVHNGGGTSKPAKQPVSFAPNLASIYKQSVPGVPGLIESSVTNGFLVLPVGDVSHMLTPQAKQSLGLSTRTTATDGLSAHSSYAVRSNAPSAGRREAGVCRLAQPEGRPKDCMFVRIPEGVLRLPRTVYADTASDCSIIKASVARSFGISMQELPGRTVHMSTVGGVFSQPTILTKPVTLVFNKGGRELYAHVVFLVADVDALPYDIILGTPLLDALGAEVDFKTESLRLFPRWCRFKDASAVVQVPLAIKAKTNPSGLPVGAPVISATQVAAGLSVPHTLPCNPTVAVPVLCCDPQGHGDC